MCPFLGCGLTSFLTQGPYSPDNFVRDRFLSKNIFRRGRSPAFHAHCEKVACVLGAREIYRGPDNKGAVFASRRSSISRAQYFYAPATRAKGHVTYAAFNGQCNLKPLCKRDTTLLDVTFCVRLHTLFHVVACCWELLRKVWNWSNYDQQSWELLANNVASVCTRLK